MLTTDKNKLWSTISIMSGRQALHNDTNPPKAKRKMYSSRASPKHQTLLVARKPNMKLEMEKQLTPRAGQAQEGE